MDCPQFEGITFADNKEINKILREQLPNGLILTMRAVGKINKFFEISFLNEEGRVAALNRPFIINDKEIVVSLTLGPGAQIARAGITGMPVLDIVSNCNRLIEILSPCQDILELDHHYMPSGHWFNVRGFATLNCATDKTYNGKLKHQMPFHEHRNITLVRSSMGIVCKDYHSDEHIKVGCPVYRKRSVKRCDKCQSPNHTGETTMTAAADQDGDTVAHSDSQAPDQGQHGAQTAVTERKPSNWADEGIPQFHDVEVDESTMKTDLNGAGLANADQDDAR
ncbi:hypothetical protein MAM1_0300d09408 [Mucor ambiguus]|uniref:Uncharacterized protein n=1 Tax=Mucor ambiguus TaxID=91626 RepID=A0A0C9LXA1_9FUNG|nr:hypothetical protein MAM1_0300d09408 [Mucor ambiguus]